MSDFDPAELARLAKAGSREYMQYCGFHRDAIVAALQPRTVTTVDELQGLPDATVVRSSHETVYENFEGVWCQPGDPNCFAYRSETLNDELPVTVLWLPEDGVA